MILVHMVEISKLDLNRSNYRDSFDLECSFVGNAVLLRPHIFSYHETQSMRSEKRKGNRIERTVLS